jgi:exodeoxyribonuclease-3
MRLATWNVNGLRARLDFVRSWLRERRPDVAGFQELKVEDDQFPRDELAAEGYDTLVHGQKGWNGVAILARREHGGIVETARGLPGHEEMGARFLTAEVLGLSFTTIYVPNGKSLAHDDFPRKLAWLDALAVRLDDAARAGRPAIVCGDFNVCPGPLDTWNEPELHGSLFHTDEERARLARLFESGWRDLFRGRYPDLRAFSWWDYRAGDFHQGRGLRIDLLLGTDAVARRVRDVQVDREWRKKKEGLTPSDHAPVLLDLDDASA